MQKQTEYEQAACHAEASAKAGKEKIESFV